MVNDVGNELTEDTHVLMEHQVQLLFLFCQFLPFVAHVDVPNVKNKVVDCIFILQYLCCYLLLYGAEGLNVEGLLLV